MSMGERPAFTYDFLIRERGSDSRTRGKFKSTNVIGEELTSLVSVKGFEGKG